MRYSIRNGELKDLEEITKVEAVCFPASEAAGREAFAMRLSAFPDSFFVAEETESGAIIGFINGAAVNPAGTALMERTRASLDWMLFLSGGSRGLLPRLWRP